MKDFIEKHVDFEFYMVTLLSLVIASLIWPAIMCLPGTWGYENGVIENLQMVFLFVGFILCLKSKYNKKFFIFAGLLISIIMLREINCGRTLFFPIPGTVNQFYKWKDIPYGYLAHPLYGAYIAGVVIYFLKNKCYIPLKNMITKVKLPIWNFFLLFAGMGLGELAEKCSKYVPNPFVFEEMGELLFYVSLVGIIWLYTKNDNFVVKNEE